MTFAENQEWERGWWDTCQWTFSEEVKQIEYAKRMGLVPGYWGGHYPVIDVDDATVVDLGGGPVSLLLKCVNLGKGSYVVDPCRYPDWVEARYNHCDITFSHSKAEDFKPTLGFSEAWIYNVLQHVDDPEKVIAAARMAAPTLRIFEWIDVPAHEGHPHTLTEETLREWCGEGEYAVEEGVDRVWQPDSRGGMAFYGVFKRRKK